MSQISHIKSKEKVPTSDANKAAKECSKNLKVKGANQQMTEKQNLAIFRSINKL